MSNNQLRTIVEEFGRPSKVLEHKLKGVIATTTFYKIIDERGIPLKVYWGTVENIAKALGYKIVFVKNDNNILDCPECGSIKVEHLASSNYRCVECGIHFASEERKGDVLD